MSYDRIDGCGCLVVIGVGAFTLVTVAVLIFLGGLVIMFGVPTALSAVGGLFR